MNRGAIFCFALVALACGWMVFAPAPGERNEEQVVKKAFDDYVRAFATGNGTEACDRLTGKARAAVVRVAGRVGATDCPSAMRKTHELGGSGISEIARTIRVRKVQVDNVKARVTLDAAGDDAVAEMEKIGDDWKVASLPNG